jgi:hypothetical protein
MNIEALSKNSENFSASRVAEEITRRKSSSLKREMSLTSPKSTSVCSVRSVFNIRIMKAFFIYV